MDTHTRSIVKTLIWRTLAMLITACVAFAVTGRIEFAAAIGVADTLIKLAAYYVHERMWNQVSFGRLGVKDYSL